IWGKPADLAKQYLSKGSQVMVDGRIKYEEFTDKEGKKRCFTEIVATDIVFLDKKAIA
ncbi:MAG: single-stranded DNA-binding protein, partial [Bacteroidetes bacterium]|nr:single-stranded DNA-binding protein [Bacteroidota bacterium]